MRILVAYDGSPGSDDALADLAVAGLPDDAHARVVAVCAECAPAVGEASSASRFGAPADASHPVRDRARLALDHARTVAGRGEEKLRRTFAGWHVTHGAVQGEASDALIDAATDWNADLIVLGSHTGRSAVPEVAFGSVARRVVAEATCTVRVGRVPARPAPTGDAPRDHPGRRVIVGFDGSEGAEAAVTAAAGRRWAAGSVARVLVVVDPIDGNAGGPSDSGIPWKWLREWAGDAAGRLRAGGLDARADVVTGNPRRLLADAATDWGADVLFVGARGEHGAGRPLAGSVATAAVARAPCSVEVVRPRP